MSYLIFLRTLKFTKDRLIVCGDLRIEKEMQLQERVDVSYDMIKKYEITYLSSQLNSEGFPYKGTHFMSGIYHHSNKLKCISLTLADGTIKRIIIEFMNNRSINKLIKLLEVNINK